MVLTAVARWFFLLASTYSHAPRIAIVGVGFVGGSFAYSLMIHGTVSEMALIDVDKKRVEVRSSYQIHGL